MPTSSIGSTTPESLTTVRHRLLPSKRLAESKTYEVGHAPDTHSRCLSWQTYHCFPKKDIAFCQKLTKKDIKLRRRTIVCMLRRLSTFIRWHLAAANTNHQKTRA